MSISAGPAGNAEAEAQAIWTAGIDLSDLTAVAAADLAILKVERENAENAETEAFNPAIEAASGAAAEALQCGKIKYAYPYCFRAAAVEMGLLIREGISGIRS